MNGDLRDSFGELENDETRFVIVTNLDESITDYDLRERFEKFGHVPTIQMPFETELQYGKCARLKFALAPAARAACSKLGGKQWRGQRIQAYTYDRWTRMLDKKKGNKNAVFQEVPVLNKIFVGGLGQNITVHMMRNYFRRYGSIDFRQSKIITDRSGHSKGFGFIVFEEVADAQSALAQTIHWLGNKQVNVGPVHEKKRVQVFGGGNNTVQDIDENSKEDSKKSSRSRSYSKSSRSGSSRSSSSRRSHDSEAPSLGGSRSRSNSRSRSRSKSKDGGEKKKHPATTPTEEFRSELTEAEPTKDEKPEDVEAYKKEVAKQLEEIEDMEIKEKTLAERRAERRARWKKRAGTT